MPCSRSTDRTSCSCAIAPDRFAVRAVEVAQTSNGQTPILQGLKGDEQVVVRGSFVLKSQLLRAALDEG